MELSDVAAIVTAGAPGLRFATAATLARARAHVAIFDLIDDLGEEVAQAIGGLYVGVDVADDSAIGQGEDVHGKARILVNCAGIGPAGKTVDRHGLPLALTQFARLSKSTLSVPST